jgi:hypothetical protein
VSKSGYQDWTGHISGNPSPGETLSQYANLVEIQPTITVEPTRIGGDKGYIVVDSVPQGARLTFDATDQGLTPATVSVSTTGSPSHTFMLEKSGYQDYYGQVPRNPSAGETIYADVAYLQAIQPTVTPTPTPTIIGNDYGWFKIVPFPDMADITFDDSYLGTGTQLVKVLTTGSPSHDLLVRKSGYQDYRQHISYNPGKDETIPLYASLVPSRQFGSITVTSDPSGALATLDSGDQYLTPCTFSPVFPGTHTISLSKSGYYPVTRQVQVNNENQKVYVSLSMMASSGTLYVDSVPRGADVKIDNIFRGQTPVRVGNLASGDHTVKLRLSGFQTLTQEVRVTQGQESQISPSLIPNPLDVKTGSVSVSSTPGGASVFLNNDYQGVTQSGGYLDLPDIIPGVYTITLKDPHYEEFSQTITVTAGKMTPVNAVLKAPAQQTAVNGTLSISSSPAGAQVLLDNRFVGVTPLMLNTVTPGDYSLILKMDGYDDYANTIRIGAGMITPASINLTQKTAPAKTQSTEPTATAAPEPTRSPLPALLVPAGIVAALLLSRRLP